jgi:hypothetical protein
VILSLSPSPCLLPPLVRAETAAVLAGSASLTGDGVRLARSSVPPALLPLRGTGRGAAGLVLFARRGWSG